MKTATMRIVEGERVDDPEPDADLVEEARLALLWLDADYLTDESKKNLCRYGHHCLLRFQGKPA